MGEKDKIEKLLEDYPDVFADIINVLVYQGEEVVKPEELRTTNIRSQYKASDDVLHEEERDTLKEWNNKKGFKVLFGIENQTIKDKKMPLRVIAYDGASYRSQMLKKGAKEFCKVITLILHFGDNQWKDDKELREVINQESVNEELFQNYKLNVFDIAYLTEEQIKAESQPATVEIEISGIYEYSMVIGTALSSSTTIRIRVILNNGVPNGSLILLFSSLSTSTRSNANSLLLVCAPIFSSFSLNDRIRSRLDIILLWAM